MDRLFDLDPQLLFDAAVTAFCVFVMVTFLSYFFIEPVRKLLAKRQEKIATELSDAARDKTDALQLKAQYEEKLQNADKEAEKILGEARKKALNNENRIIQEAKEEAAHIRERAKAEIELEKQAAAEEMKQQMIRVAAMMAGKVVAASIDEKKQDALIQETLKEMGDQVWLS